MVTSSSTVVRMSHGSTWQEQWQRIRRSYDAVLRSRDGFRSDNPFGTEGYRDEVFFLFQNLWHLKDWIKNDSAVPQTARDQVEQWLDNDGHNLKIAADVANGSKHLTLSNPR